MLTILDIWHYTLLRLNQFCTHIKINLWCCFGDVRLVEIQEKGVVFVGQGTIWKKEYLGGVWSRRSQPHKTGHHPPIQTGWANVVLLSIFDVETVGKGPNNWQITICESTAGKYDGKWEPTHTTLILYQ